MADAFVTERPVLWGVVGTPVPFTPNTGGGKKVGLPTTARQGERLGGRFTDLDSAFDEQAILTESLGASDPQLVIVFEAIDEREDLSGVASLAGLEILAEVDRDFEPHPDFPRKSVNKGLPVTGCLHAVCISEQAKASIIGQWNKWQATGKVDRGYAPLKQLFAHLRDVRPPVRGNVIEVTPPLTITHDEVTTATHLLTEAIDWAALGHVTDDDIAPYSGW